MVQPIANPSALALVVELLPVALVMFTPTVQLAWKAVIANGVLMTFHAKN